MSLPNSDSPLSQLLRSADPLLDDPGLDTQEAARLRRTVTSQVADRSVGLWRQLSPALSVAALLVLALGIAWWPVEDPGAATEPAPRRGLTSTVDTPGVGSTPLGGGDALENRKIQFETPGGTLVVWVLNPNFPS